MSPVMTTGSLFSAQFEAFLREREDRSPAWLQRVRQMAFHQFQQMGFPTLEDEEWRFTPIHPIVDTDFVPASSVPVAVTSEQLAPYHFQGMDYSRIVFVNGRYSPELTSLRPLPNGVQAGSLAAHLSDDPDTADTYLARFAAYDTHAFAALNTAFMDDGAFVYIPRNVVVEEPIRLLFISTTEGAPTVSHPRVLVVAGANSQCSLIESYVGLKRETYLTNAVTEIIAGENAVVDHYKTQRESMDAYHISYTHVQLSRNANFRSHAITLGGGLVRNDVYALLNGEGIDCTLNGLYLVNGRRMVDNHTTLDHARPHCSSHQIYKGVLDEHGRGVFNGKIFVRQDAQKTDAKQTNQALLLSDNAQINTKPQLEIFADDVKCTHGATVGQLDADQLFYLRARGIDLEDARSLLIHAFAMDILDRIQIEALRRALDEVMLAQLPKPH